MRKGLPHEMSQKDDLMTRWERLREDEIMRRLRRNVRRFILYVKLRGEREPIPVWEGLMIKSLLQKLAKWESDPDYQAAFIEIEY